MYPARIHAEMHRIGKRCELDIIVPLKLERLGRFLLLRLEICCAARRTAGSIPALSAVTPHLTRGARDLPATVFNIEEL